MFKRYVLFWFKITVLPFSLAWGITPSDQNDQCRRSVGLIGDVVQVPPPSELKVTMPNKSWLRRPVARKFEKVKNAVDTMMNTSTSDPKHIQSISSLLEYSREDHELLIDDVVDVLLSYFVQSINRDLEVENKESIQYDVQTSQQLLETLITVYKKTKNYKIFSLLKYILENPSERLVFSRNPSKFDHIPIVDRIVQTLKDDVNERPEILRLFGRLLTDLEDFYITYANAYMNQSVFMEQAVESIVVNIALFVNRDPNILHDLFERLSLLYDRKHPVRHDHSRIEYRHATIESIKRHLKPRHIPFLMTTGNVKVLQTLVRFFTRDFHFPSKKIIQQIADFIRPLSNSYFLERPHTDQIQMASMQILAARELAGETDPYAEANFKGRARWVQPPTIAPSRLTSKIHKQIRRLLEAPDSSPEVRGLAQKIIEIITSQGFHPGVD